jgi:hypothetical protein
MTNSKARITKLEKIAQPAAPTWKEFITMARDDFENSYNSNPQFRAAWDAVIAQEDNT